MEFKFFTKRDLVQENQSSFSLKSIPDPKINICGLFLFRKPKQVFNFPKVDRDAFIASRQQPVSQKSVDRSARRNRSKTKEIRDMTSVSVNRRVNNFAQNNKTKMNKKFNEIKTKKSKKTVNKPKERKSKRSVVRQKARTPNITSKISYKNYES